MQTDAVADVIPQESKDAITSSGLDLQTVIQWIMSHGYQGAQLLRQLLPMLPFSQSVKDAILVILNILYPSTPVV